jgi:hypothetical protein
MAKKLKDATAQKLYHNVGASELVFDGVTHVPGSRFRTTMPAHQELQLLQGGHIEVVDESVPVDEE